MRPVPGKVGLVFVSHSAKIAEGLVDLASQMARETALAAAGGTDEGDIGTSFDLVTRAITAVDADRGVVVLCDLGSAILTAETALDFLEPEVRAGVLIVDAPLVEGAVAAAVEADGGGDLEAVAAAARTATGDQALVQPATVKPPSTGYSRTVVIVNKDGLHARPAAEFVKLANSLGVPVTVNGQDARSLLGIMSMGLVRGRSIELSSTAEGGEAAVDALAELVESGFGEA